MDDEHTQIFIMSLLNKLEQAITKKDKINYTGIISEHMIAIWIFRDRINDYFNNKKMISTKGAYHGWKNCIMESKSYGQKFIN